MTEWKIMIMYGCRLSHLNFKFTYVISAVVTWSCEHISVLSGVVLSVLLQCFALDSC